MSYIAWIWPSTSRRSYQYAHDNVGSHYVVSKRHLFHNVATQKLTAGTSYRTLFNGLENGGPAGLIYGYLFVWCGATLQALVMAEMASMYVLTKAISTVSSV